MAPDDSKATRSQFVLKFECRNVVILQLILSTMSDKVSLSVSLSDINILFLPGEILEKMWNEAEQFLLLTRGQAMEAPCSSLAVSNSSDRPDIIQKNLWTIFI